MGPVHKLDSKVSVTGQIAPNEMVDVAAQGFGAVINNRNDGEQPGQPSSEEECRAAEAAGLIYLHIPMAPQALSPEVIEAFQNALMAAQGPVLAHCGSGMRSAALWALCQVRYAERTIDDTLSRTAEAGFNLEGLRPMLQSLAEG